MDFFTYERMCEPLDQVTLVHNISRPEDLLTKFQSPPFDDAKWAFRGHSDAEWLLQPSIERLAHKPGIGEAYVEREFKRRAHHYLTDLPKEEDDLEWLALMQHHGAPTRLLDWTKSPYVAGFFAAADAKPGSTFAIWAIDQESVHTEAVVMLGLNNRDDERNLSSRENFKKVYRERQSEDLCFTVVVQPYRMNERLTIQQGLFLCANQPLLGFQRCLKRLLDHGIERNSGHWLHKMIVQPEARLGLLSILNRMNINFATLFPGLDGFAMSLRSNTEILDSLDWPLE